MSCSLVMEIYRVCPRYSARKHYIVEHSEKRAVNNDCIVDVIGQAVRAE